MTSPVAFTQVYSVVSYECHYSPEIRESTGGIFADVVTAKAYVDAVTEHIDHPILFLIRCDLLTTATMFKNLGEMYPDGFCNCHENVIERRFIGEWTEEMIAKFSHIGHVYETPE